MNSAPDPPDFIKQITDTLKQQDVQGTMALFNNNQNYEIIKNSCWELFPVVTPYLTFKYENNNMNLFKCCQEMINRIAEICNPEETLLQFIDEIEECNSDTKFSTMLPAMLKVLQRIPKNRVSSISWCLNAISVYLNKIDITEKDRHDECVLRSEMIYHDVLNVYDILIEYYSDSLTSSNEFCLVFLKHLVNLLGKPLGFFDLDINEKKTRIRIIAEKIVGKIIFLQRDPLFFIDIPEKSAPLPFSYGIFLYLVLYEKINHAEIPKIHNKSYIFYSSLPYLIELLKTDKSLITSKGLNSIMDLLQTEEHLSYRYLELKVNKELCEALENVIVFNEDEKLRKQALMIFQNYIENFDSKGKYLVLINLLPNIKHSGFASFLITTYKNIIVNLQRTQSEDMYYFSGRKLNTFMYQCCYMSKEDEYNIINITEKIMSLLNLMRFVVLQEKSENMEIFRKTAANWRRLYLDRLTILIAKSKREFNEKKHEIEQGRDTDQQPDLFVGGERVQEISSREKIKNIELSVTGFQMIESLLDRLIELLKLRECYD